ncbi:MAG: HD domain-containing protein [Bacteroidales bacterium]|nr:HD domain-containing protein [Bacteroidales bacterium]
MEKLWNIYCAEQPDFIAEIAKSPELERLKDVGMNCGCEYTSFSFFKKIERYSRFEHSVGVALITWNFTKDIRQTIAALLHDISTPVFAHVVDFLRGDHLKQEATEEQTKEFIASSAHIMAALDRLGVDIEEVCDYHKYPIADNDTPGLSADRLEYTLGNIVNFGFGSKELVAELYSDITVTTNEKGEKELAFRHIEKAVTFAQLSLKCSIVYVCDEDRYAMQMLAELLGREIAAADIDAADLYLTERQIIDKICVTEKGRAEWDRFCSYSHILTCKKGECESLKDSQAFLQHNDLEFREIRAKKRYIDPIVAIAEYDKAEIARVSELSPLYRDELNIFLQSPQDYLVAGY